MGRSIKNPYIFYSLFVTLIAGAVSFAIWQESTLSAWACFLIGINTASFFCMGLDKSLARTFSTRVPEVIFYCLALLGAVPGTLLGVYIFKHKTRAAPFQFTLLLIVVTQAALIELLGLTDVVTQW